MDSTNDHDNAQKAKIFAPSRFVVVVDDEDHDSSPKKYRLCAAAAVWNSQDELLVGERLHGETHAWQAPQGGVNAAFDGKEQEESIVQAACRELYEEMGLVVGQHVVLLSNNNTDPELLSQGIRYETNGTMNWLTQAGFAGQQLHWVHFRCVDGRGDSMASGMCDLTGQNGEDAEFRYVTWKPLDTVIQGMWPAKRKPYESLQVQYEPLQHQWQKQCQACATEFAGLWSRDNAQCHNVPQGLMARGMSEEEAHTAALKPYVQEWKFNHNTPELDWTVITYHDDGQTPRRTLVYPWGEWEEAYHGQSTLFGSTATTATLQRRSFYAPEPLDDVVVVAHVTISQTPKGDTEEARRYRHGEHFILKRTFWAKNDNADPENNGVVSTEVFVKQPQQQQKQDE